MISFPILFINLLSILMMLLVIFVIWNIRDKNGAKQLFVASLFMLFWSVGSFADLLASTLQAKLFWRNITQIGVFFTPVATLMFIIVYTGFGNTKRKMFACISYTFQTIGILLVWTDGYHHLIRQSISILKTPLSKSLVIEPTRLAQFLISINFLFSVIALGVLGIYALSTTTVSRKQSMTVFGGLFVATSYSLLKVVMGERFAQLVPISGIFALSALFMLLGIYRYDLLKIAPLAREQVFHFLGDGLVIASVHGNVLEANQAALSMMGPTLSSLEANIVAEVPQWQRFLVNAKEVEFSFYRRGTYYTCSIYAIKTGHGSTIGTVSLLKDSTEQKRKSDLLQVRAERDGLTGIYNRQTFIEKVEMRLLTTKQEVSLIYFDIDHFKLINDKYGHTAGDQMLKAVVDCAYMTMVDSDLLGRMGGEEFALFHLSESEEETLLWAEILRKQVEESILSFDGNSASCTISIGVSFSKAATFDQLYKSADSQLYKAKHAGRNCIRHTHL